MDTEGIIVLFTVINIAIVALFIRVYRSDKTSGESKATTSSVESSRPVEPMMSETSDEDSDEDPDESSDEVSVGKGGDTRVVTSFATRKDKTEDGKSKTPYEAEFKQLMIWTPSATEVKTCGCCGAEMDRLTAVCSACGQTN